MGTEDRIRTLRPQPGDVIVFTTPRAMKVGEVWAIKLQLNETFPDNLVAVATQGTIGYRFEAFTDEELTRLRNCIFADLTETNDSRMARVLDEIEAELGRRCETTSAERLA